MSSTQETLVRTRTDDNNYSRIRFDDDGTLVFEDRISSSTVTNLVSNAQHRDLSSWYHVLVRVDYTQATAGDRARIYVNGSEVTYSSTTRQSQSGSSYFNSANSHDLGHYNSNNYFNGSMTHVHFTDGYSYAPSTFGETDSTSGIWKPKTAPSVTYGNNGYFLKMENSGAMGTDSSGNSNTFTVSGTLTQNVDTPSNNFATLNPLDVGRWTQSNTFSNGNLTVTTSDYISANGSLAVSSGKFYWEVEYDTAGGSNIYAGAGIINYDGWDGTGGGGSGANTYIYATSGQKVNSASGSAFGATLSAGDIVGIALDMTNGFLYFSKNGTWQNSGDPTSGASGTGSAYGSISGTIGCHLYDGSGSIAHEFSANFGQGYFGTTAVSSAQADDGGLGIMEYDVPANYRVLCTKNIKDYG